MINDPEELKDEELASDIKEECSKFGLIKSMEIYVPQRPEDKIRVFLEFEDHDGKQALLRLLYLI